MAALKPPEPGGLAAALAAFQAEIPTVAKGKTGDAGSYRYQYADLSDVTEKVLPLLGKHGLSFSAKPMRTDDGQFVLRYVLRHVSGESDGGDYPLPPSGNAQQIGSAITYARRYALCAVTGVAPGGDDDDGASAKDTHIDTRQQQWEEPTPVDPAEDREFRDQYERDIAEASEDEIAKIGRGVKSRLARREISKQSYDYLDRKAAERLAELRAAKPEPAKVAPATDKLPPGRAGQIAAMDRAVAARKAATDGSS